MKGILFALLILTGSTAIAEVIFPVRTIRAREIINAEDLVRKPLNIAGALSNPQDIVGMEARIVLYADRPIKPGDIGPPAIISRNDLISLIFTRGSLRISTEGRALGRGAVGETIKVMNMTSRQTVMGVVLPNGSIEVR